MIITMEPKEVDQHPSDELLQEMRRNNELMARLIHVHSDWRLALRQGLFTGLGGILGATLLVSLLVWVIQPLKRLDALKPTLDNISRQLERGPK